jgi:prefoldin subunit 5
MDELETALERLASRSEYLASQVEKLARFNGNLRREVTESLREIDDLIAEQTNA